MRKQLLQDGEQDVELANTISVSPHDLELLCKALNHEERKLESLMKRSGTDANAQRVASTLTTLRSIRRAFLVSLSRHRRDYSVTSALKKHTITISAEDVEELKRACVELEISQQLTTLFNT